MSGFDPRDAHCKLEILRVAVARLRGLRKERQDYDDEVAEWYSRGDGRSPKWIEYYVYDPEDPDAHERPPINVGGKGYTFPACIHGRSRWTDYDNICGPCEDGHTMYQLAHAYAWNAVKSTYERTDVLMQLLNLHAPGEAVAEVGEWSAELVRIHPHPRRGGGKVVPPTPGLLPPLDPRRLP